MVFNRKNEDSDNVDLLNYIYHNAKIGSQNIANILPKINNQELQNTLLNKLTQYQGIANQASELLDNLNETPKENTIDKLSNKAGIAVNTLTDTSTSHIAEIMINESTSDIISLTKKMNENIDCPQNVSNLYNDLINIEEQNTEDLKQFL